MLNPPSFDFWIVAYTAMGAALFWGKWGRVKLRAYVLSDLVDLFNLGDRSRNGIEFFIFVALGVFVGIGLTAPTNPAQAFAAGMGWTGLLTRHGK